MVVRSSLPSVQVWHILQTIVISKAKFRLLPTQLGSLVVRGVPVAS